MSYYSLLSQTATVVEVTPGTKNAYGVPTRRETDGVTERCLLQPAEALEIEGGRDTRVDEWVLFLLPNTTVKGTSKLRVDGATYDVVGDPKAWFDPRRGRLHHYEARVRKVTA